MACRDCAHPLPHHTHHRHSRVRGGFTVQTTNRARTVLAHWKNETIQMQAKNSLRNGIEAARRKRRGGEVLGMCHSAYGTVLSWARLAGRSSRRHCRLVRSWEMQKLTLCGRTVLGDGAVRSSPCLSSHARQRCACDNAACNSGFEWGYFYDLFPHQSYLDAAFLREPVWINP